MTHMYASVNYDIFGSGNDLERIRTKPLLEPMLTHKSVIWQNLNYDMFRTLINAFQNAFWKMIFHNLLCYMLDLYLYNPQQHGDEVNKTPQPSKKLLASPPL